ncbi:DUF262 domain-containing protein [Rhodopseudomonas palustris]|uniref:DUF262 domain-containing protein n=1 Tax=Rhodopseudomonas palustris TaxID=1076 RepID=UPI0020CFE021|nr:DUF262 domain-containing protein [Rhodopseudomonas palustris]MCP9629161.1 DUF262 domain-containing protein [Rhodopseudomonas palustris]
MERRAVFQPFAWFNDLYVRSLIDLDPPYQRRSVWNDEYREFFIDTVLQNYPCPAIFLYEEISPQGVAKYKVVDGKQRLSTLFSFVKGEIAIGDKSRLERLRGQNFDDLDDDTKKSVWRYQFSVEFIPQESEAIISDIFDRINRNVARLSPQELRHARFGGAFISEIEAKTEWMFETLPNNFPYITRRSRGQMKDVEFVAQLFLFIENGESSTSQSDLDAAFSKRDASWEAKENSANEFTRAIEIIKSIVHTSTGKELVGSRLRNQADFYSLFAATVELVRKEQAIELEVAAKKLLDFVNEVEDPEARAGSSNAMAYYEAARSASNDASPRRKRIDSLKALIAKDDTN